MLFVPDDETRLELLERDEIDAFFAEGEVNIGRRAAARGFDAVGAFDGDGGAVGIFGPTWWELDLDPSRLGSGVASAVVEAVDPALAAEILEDSGKSMSAIPAVFPHDGRPSGGPWEDRGSLAEAKQALGSGGREFQLAYASGSAAGGIATFIHFRLKELDLTAELVGAEPDSFERLWVTERRAPAMLRLRRGADAPDAASYAAAARRPGSGPVDDQVADAQTVGGGTDAPILSLVGLEAEPWTEALRGLFAAKTAAPLARVRTWIVAGDGVYGPMPTGAADGPLWNAAVWRLER